ncbi:TPA: hypothetical protein ACGO5G_000762 [Streptococcus suis]
MSLIIRREEEKDQRAVEELIREKFDKTFPYKEKLVLPGQLDQ